MKKQFLRVKQIADQTFLRAEKTEVLTDDLLTAEKRVDSIKASCQATQKKITSCQIDFGSETSIEKRLRKIPQVNLGTSMLESGSSFQKNSVLGDTLRECATVQTKLGTELLEYYNEVEKLVLKPVSGLLENEIHNISKLRKQLGKLVLDMDSARTRFQTAERHSLQASCNTNLNVVGKVDTLKEELEDASQKVEQCRDTLAAEMFSLISREPQLAQLLVQFHQLQATYHRNALSMLESSLPSLNSLIADFPQKPVYGCSLRDHLRVTNRDIAQVIETCVSFLLEYGILEEGLLRIAGSSTKLKKIKTAFDAGIEIDLSEFVRDPHAVSGALKSYLRELPEPLMTFSLYNEWMNAAKVQDSDAKLQALWQVLHKLPDENFKNLRYVIKFLSKIHENMDVNKMSSQNIAIVMAPNLIWSPSDDGTSLGMNMSTASLHTSIVDLLISYVEWFFPEENDDTRSRSPSSVTNLNETKKCSSPTSDTHQIETEVNGNNLQVLNNTCDVSPSSPRSPHKGIKKPAAPPPPALKNIEETSSRDIVPDGDLIDLSKDSMDMVLAGEESVCKLKKDSTKEIVDRQEKCNDGIVNDISAPKGDKPAIPDKPGYTSLSLDRRSIRHSSFTKGSRTGGANRASDIMSRSHIERPSVPPPERPAKPPKFSTSTENVFTSTSEQNKPQKEMEIGDNSSFHNSCKLSPGGERRTECVDDNAVPTSNVIKNESCANALQHSRSFSKVNRFDFLVNQKEDKPPERPPRTVGVLEGSTKPEIAGSSIQLTFPAIVESNFPVPPPVAPRTGDVEKIKPARPQPPLPAKPKFPTQNENTSL